MRPNIIDPELMLRQDLRDFPPYSMSHVPLADLDHLIKSDLNENPYGPSPNALAALAEMRHYSRYIGQDELRVAIARYVGVDVSHIVVSNGADEMIDIVQRIFLDRGDAIVDCPPSFEMYSFFARLNGATIIAVPRLEDFSLDIDGIVKFFEDRTGKSANGEPAQVPKLVFIANPSNPDGGLASNAQIERLLALPAIIVLDEAYAEFACTTLSSRVPSQPNLIVLRTFSKWAGIAGLRVGYCVAPQPIAAKILQCKSPENVNAAGIVAAQASLDDRQYLLANVRRVVEERERLSAALVQLKFLQPLPSQANFILCRVLGRDANEIRNALSQRGILIRAFGSPRLSEYIRISVGTPAQDEVLVESLRML